MTALKGSIEALEKLRATPEKFRSSACRAAIEHLETSIEAQTEKLSKPKKPWSPDPTQVGMLLGTSAVFGLLLLGASQSVIPWKYFIWLGAAYLVAAAVVGFGLFLGDMFMKSPDQLRTKNNKLSQKVENLSARRVIRPWTRRRITKKREQIAKNERKIVERTRS